MARIAQVGRLEDLVKAGLASFIRHGYRRTRIADAAEAADIAPGTVYLYVAGKEALFELAVRLAFDEPDALNVETPYAPATGDWVEHIWALFIERDPLVKLRQALERPPVLDSADEWERLLRDLWEWMSHYWQAIALIEACADDWPDLGLLFHRQFRSQALDQLARFIDTRKEAGRFSADVDPHVAARAVVEVMAWFAIHRHTDSDASDIADRNVEETLITMLTRAL